MQYLVEEHSVKRNEVLKTLRLVLPFKKIVMRAVDLSRVTKGLVR